MLLISRSKYLKKRLMFDRWTVVYIFFDLQLPPLAPKIFFSFSNHQGPVFFLFLLLSLPSSVLQWHHEGGNFSSEFDRSNWLFNVGYYLEVSSLLYVQELIVVIMILLKILIITSLIEWPVSVTLIIRYWVRVRHFNLGNISNWNRFEPGFFS